MTTRFEFNSIYEESHWTVLYPDAQGYQDKFLSLCMKEMQRANFPNMETEIEEFKTGGVFFNVEKTKMLAVSFQKSQFKNLGVYFRAQRFGNVVYYSLLKTVDLSLWEQFKGKPSREIRAGIRAKLKNLAQVEEYQALSALGELVFDNVLRQMDEDFAERRDMDALAGV